MPMAQTTGAVRNSRLLMLAAIIVVVAALYFAQEVLIPVALAIMFSFLLAPLVIRLQRLRIGRVPAVITVVVIVAGAFGALGWVVYVQIQDLAGKLPEYQQNIEEKVTWVRRFTSGGAIEKATKVIEKSIEKATTQPTAGAATRPALAVAQVTVQQPPSLPLRPSTQPAAPVEVFVTNLPVQTGNPFRNLWASLSPLLGPLGTAGIVAVIVIFMLIEREDLRDRVIRLIGQGRINVTTQAMDEAASRVSRYLLAQCFVNGTYGLAIGLGLWLIGHFIGHADPPFPNAPLWALLTAVLRFIPYLGPWIGAAFPIVLSMAVYHGMAVPLAVIGMFVLVELISNNAMEPWLYGVSTGVSTMAILVAAVFWTWLWGAPGLLLSTPLTVIIVVMGKYIPQLEFLNVLLGDQPPLAPRYRLYQRLLAEDVEEAEDLLVDLLKEQPLEEVYDSVVVPAMGLAESEWHRDRLDDRKQAMVRESVRELVEAIGDLPREAESPAAPKSASKLRERDSGRLAEAAGPAAEEPKDDEALRYDRCLLCIPARDQADEIAGSMLAQLLQRRGYCPQYLSVEKLASEYLDAVERQQAQVVIISALPPAAVTHARYIVKRLRARFHDLKIIVGLWTMCGEITRARARLAAAGTDLVVCSFAEMLEKLRQVIAPLALQEASAAKSSVGA